MIAQADTDGDTDDGEYEDEYGDADEGLSDPLYHWNYTWYVFNDRVYLWLLEPTAEGYSAVMPEQAQGGCPQFLRQSHDAGTLRQLPAAGQGPRRS